MTTTVRNHRLRERRLRLGKSQREIGELAGFTRNPGNRASLAERGETKRAGDVRKVREALVYLEMKPCQEREWARQEAAAVTRTAVAIANIGEPANEDIVIDRLVDLLWQGRGDEFDTLCGLLPDHIGQAAGDRYLDECMPATAGAVA